MFITCQAIPGVPKIEDGYNPATWMLDISTPAAEHQIGVDFAEIYSLSSLYQSVVEELQFLFIINLFSMFLSLLSHQ